MLKKNEQFFAVFTKGCSGGAKAMDRLKRNQMVYIPKSNPVVLYKKLNSDMTSPYQLFKYTVGKVYSVKEFDENVDKQCVKDRIYSIPKDQLSKWHGIRFFEVRVWGKCILEKNNKVGSEYLKIIKELKPKEFIEYMAPSQAYCYCDLIKDTKEIRNLITDSYLAYLYCKNIKDRKEVRDKIIDSEWAYLYYIYIKNRKEIRDRIIDPKLIQGIRDKENAKNKKSK